MKRNSGRISTTGAANSSSGDEMDSGGLYRDKGMLPIVGLGGSAGAIAALQEFFAVMPQDSGMAFVVILHLSPTHESTLAELIQRSTTMSVVVATNGASVKPNSVYVIPPGKFLESTDGHLRLTDAEQHRGKRVAVDHFFRTLAETHGPQSVAVVFSGAGGDGTLGLKRVKELGGLTIAQDPDEAEHPGMPRSAITTGVVDWVLGVKEMPPKLLAYVKQREELNLPDEEGPQPGEIVKLSPDEHETALRDVLAFLHTRTGRDFLCYKRATIVRRIARRMQVNGLSDLPGYLGYLRTHTGEAGALLQDLLISVTNFFRDPVAFAALERTIPELFKGKNAGDTVRVWVAGCATGEEAYSIAMLLCEHADTLVGPPQLQIFATDLDEEVIREAREGLYPESIAADVGEERLRHFFIQEKGGYRVRRALRELVLFAPHDLLKDSPFSRLDFISCRNLLIYLNREAQSRAFDIFHFALRSSGRLFLGTSEAVDEGSPLFAVLDKKQRLYVQRPGPQRLIAVPTGPGTLARALALQERTRERPTVPGRVAVDSVSNVVDTAVPFDSGLPPGELHYRLIERFSPPSILVNSAHEIVHLSESAGRFLQFAGGEPTRNLLRTVHPMLRVELRAALYAAAQTDTVATAARIPIETGDARSLVDIRVTPAGDLAPDFLLVVFDEYSADGAVEVAALRNADADQTALHLERELVATKAHLRDTIEESEASTEELKASNEELQAMNEELRSATEELETSREELQSINEELTTVNEQLKSNVDQLARSNNDLQNLMAATDIATVFLDRELRIQRFTPSAKVLFNFIPTDLGRPLSDLTRQLDYPEIVVDAERSLDHLQPSQREVKAGERWYIARTLPYRTTDDHIAGVVLTFLDITEQKRAEEEIARLADDSERQRRVYETVLTNTPDFVYVFSLDHRVLYANDALIKMWGRGYEGAIGKTFLEIGYEPWHASMHEREIDQVRVTRKPIRGEVPFNGTNGRRQYEYIFVPVVGADGEVEAVAGTTRDVTERKEAEERLRASEARQSILIALADTIRPLSDPTTVQTEASRVLGEWLRANRVVYFEVQGEDYVVERDYTDAVPSIVGRHPIASFGAEQLALYRAGRTACETDVDTLATRSRIEKEAFSALQIRSYVAVPLVKSGVFVAGLAVHSANVREWTPTEIAIIEDAAERTWAAVERVRAEAALRQSEERSAFVRRSSGVGFWYCDLPFDVLQWDELVKAHFHLPPDAEVTIQTFYDRIHPDDREPTRLAIERSIEGRTPYTVDYRTVNPDTGDVTWVRAIGRTFYAADGSPIRFDGVTLDITEQKRAEESLRDSQQRLEAVLYSIDDGLIVLDREWRYTYFSEKAARIVGVRREAMLGGVVWDLFPHAEGTKFYEEYHRAVATGQPLHFEEFYPDPINKWLECHCYPSSDGLTVYFRDVTDRKLREAERDAAQRTLASLVEQCPFGIYIVDADFRLSNVNAGSKTGAFRNVHPLIGRPFVEVMHTIWPEPVAAEVLGKFRHTLATGEPYISSDFVSPRADIDETEGYEWELHRLTLTDGRHGVVCYYYDATKLRRIEQALRDADRRKDEFLATLAHELRNPLAPIRNGLQVIRMAGANGTIEQARSMMERQLTQLVRLVDDLLDVSRVTSGKLELRRTRVELRSVIDAAVETSRPVIEEAGHELTVVIPDEPIWVDGDVTRLPQVVSNLLNNSAKYMHRGGRVRLTVGLEDDTAIVSVADEGIGIPPAMLDNVFEMFTQVDRALEKTTGGLGIGLSLVKGLVEMHGGTIEAHSEGEGRGSEFVVRLPIVSSAVQRVAPEETHEPIPASGRRRILVADDNVDSAASLGKLLELLGNDVSTANDGMEALDVAQTFRPDVILLDIGMPKLNGYEAARRIRAQAWGQSTVLVALTGWGQDDDRKRSSDAGFNHHLVKPVEIAVLMKLLAELPAKTN